VDGCRHVVLLIRGIVVDYKRAPRGGRGRGNRWRRPLGIGRVKAQHQETGDFVFVIVRPARDVATILG
jgi:hypothetical protein